MGAVGGLDHPVPHLLSADRAVGEDHRRAGQLPPGLEPGAVHRAAVRARRGARLRHGLHLQVRQRRVPARPGRGERHRRPGRRPGRLPAADPVRRRARRDAHPLQLLHAALRHRLGIAGADLLHRSAPRAARGARRLNFRERAASTARARAARRSTIAKEATSTP